MAIRTVRQAKVADQDTDVGVVVTGPADTSAPTRPRTLGGRWPFVLLGGWIVVMVLWKAAEPFDSDGWWHLRTGQLMLDRARLALRDPFSWVMQGKAWRQNSWLFDLFVGVVNRIGGRALVSLLMLVGFAALGVVSYKLCRRVGARVWPSVATMVPVMFLLGPYISERPQVVSCLLFAVVMVLTPTALAGSNRALIILSLTIAVWSNLHLAFSIGVLLAALLAVGTAVQDRRPRRAVTVVAVLAVSGLLNPYGFGAYTAARQVRGASQLIVEWQHASLTNVRDVLLLALAGLSLLSMRRTGRWRRLAHVLPVVVMTALTIDAIRNGPFLVLLCAPELALGATALTIPRLRAWARPRVTPLLHGTVVGLAVLALAAIGALTNARGAQPSAFAVRATAAIPAGCRLLNEYDQGGYIIYQRWPQVLVSEDGRNDLYGASRLIDQQHVLQGDVDAMQWLDQHHIDCVLARPDRPIIAQLETADWQELAHDASGILMVRPGASQAP